MPIYGKDLRVNSRVVFGTTEVDGPQGPDLSRLDPPEDQAEYEGSYERSPDDLHEQSHRRPPQMQGLSPLINFLTKLPAQRSGHRS